LGSFPILGGMFYMGTQHTKKVDVYSYKVVVLEILSGHKYVYAKLPSMVFLLLDLSLYERNESVNIVDYKLEV
jgi:hypothetical protein